MNKQIMAFSAAVLMTICIGLGILAVGGTAFFNKNGAAVSNSPSAGSGGLAAQPVSDVSYQAQIQQLEILVDQLKAREQEYQNREQQYQQQVSSVNAKLQKDDSQLAQLQQLITALQQNGVITIAGDGRVFINR